MFLKTVYFLIIGFFCIHVATAQNACDDLYNKAKSAHQKGDYADAFAKYRAVRLCNPALSHDIDKRIEQLFADVNGERQKAEKARNEALVAQQKTIEALNMANAERLKNERIVDATYFYAGKFGLGYKKHGSYGYIDKEGRVVIDFQFTKAAPFDGDGFARVEKNNVKYLLDTTGAIYELAERVSEILPTTEAIDLVGLELKEFPQKIFHAPNLNILLMAHNKLSKLPDSIALLNQLNHLDISNNELVELPNNLAKLPLAHLIINSNRLVQLPENIGNLSKLTWLEADANQLTQLPISFSELVELNYLNLDDNQLKSLPNNFEKLSKLKQLALSNNHFENSEWVYVISGMPALVDLDISKTRIRILPADFFKTISKNLEVLRLDGNLLAELPPLYTMPVLRILDLSRNPLINLSLSWNLMPNLEEFDISYAPQLKNVKLTGSNHVSTLYFGEYPLAELPNSIAELPALRALYLDDSKIKYLPKWGKAAQSLQKLYLNGNTELVDFNHIEELSALEKLDMSFMVAETVLAGLPAISKIPTLEFLDISNTDLDSLPDAIGNFLNLRRLWLSDNQLKMLPKNFNQLKKLTNIMLDGNRFTAFPEVLLSMDSLEKIEISGNKINFIADAFKHTSQLKELNIDGNHLTAIPISLQSLACLESLNLSNNQLREFPEAVLKCKTIRNLYLNQNQLTNIPLVISELSALESLDFSKNTQLQDCPSSISKLKKLESLTLSKCAIPAARISQLKKMLPHCDFD